MTHNKAFRIIGDSAGCAVVRENRTIVTVRDSLLGLCFGIPHFGFRHNLAQSTRRMTESSETALWGRPVAEAAYFEN